MSVILSASLEPFWVMVNALQMSLHLPAMNVKIPMNAKSFNTGVRTVTSMELIPED